MRAGCSCDGVDGGGREGKTLGASAHAYSPRQGAGAIAVDGEVDGCGGCKGGAATAGIDAVDGGNCGRVGGRSGAGEAEPAILVGVGEGNVYGEIIICILSYDGEHHSHEGAI